MAKPKSRNPATAKAARRPLPNSAGMSTGTRPRRGTLVLCGPSERPSKGHAHARIGTNLDSAGMGARRERPSRPN